MCSYFQVSIAIFNQMVYGKAQINHNHFLGYTKDKEGNLIIDEDEAVIIRRIFREYLEGASFRDIANGLERDKIKTGGKRYKWNLSTIQGILQNENTWVMHCFKRLSRQTSSRRPESIVTVPHLSTM